MSNIEIEDNFNAIEKEIEKKVQQAEGNVSFEQIFSPSFMKKYTDFNSIESMFEDSTFDIESEKDFDNIPEQELNEFVEEKTKFNSWEDMVAKAGQIYTAGQLEI